MAVWTSKTVFAVALMMSLAATQAQAQSLEDRLRSQLVSTVTELRQLQANQAALQAQRDAADAARKAAEAKLATAEIQLRAAKRTPRAPSSPPPEQQARDEAALNQASALHAQDQQLLADVRADNTRLEQANAALRADHERLVMANTTGETALTACRAKNAAAISVAKDILAAYDKVSLGGVLIHKEPFTGLARVRLETLEQDYGDRIYESRVGVKPRASGPTSPAPAETTNPSAPPK